MDPGPVLTWPTGVLQPIPRHGLELIQLESILTLFSMWPVVLQTEMNNTDTGGSVASVYSAIVTGVLLMNL